MKRLLLFVFVLAGLAGSASAQVANVTSRWVSGNLVFYDKSGNEIFTVDGGNRKLTVPSGSALLFGGLTAGRVAFAGASGLLADDADLTFLTDTLTATKIIGSTSITDTGLSDGRVTFAGAAGLLSDDADLTFLTDTLTAAKLKVSALTNTRVPFYSATGLVDDVDLTFATDTLTATKVVGSTSVTTPSLLTSGAGVGTAAASTVVEGLGGMHRTVFTLNLTAADLVTLADGDHGGGKLIYTFPAGEIYVLGAVLDGVVTNTAAFQASDNDHYSVAIGSVVGADDNDLTATEVSFIAKQDIDTTGGTVLSTAVKVVNATPFALDGTGTAATIFVNFAIAATQNTGSNDFGMTGTLTVTWANLGDK